jgi:predicted transcriptional regulator
MSKKTEMPLLTQMESEMMTALWKIGKGSVRDILNQLPEDGRKVAYTSAATIVKILEEKNYVKSIKDGKTHIFEPLVPLESYQKKTLRHVIDQFFSGTASGLVRNLLGDEKLSDEEKAEIRKMIEGEL